jgi:hypothetical protein
MTQRTVDFRNRADALAWKRAEADRSPRSLLFGATMESVNIAWAEFGPARERPVSLPILRGPVAPAA